MSRHESRDVASAVRRMLRALVRRAGEGDTEALVELHRLEVAASEATTSAGAALHASGHYSYTDLAKELGVSRQAARQRFLPNHDHLWSSPDD